MARHLTVVCEHCGASVERPVKEVNRSQRLGRRTFCNNKCSTEFNNVGRARERKADCKLCGEEFTSRQHKTWWTEFCSRNCASKGSVTDHRREIARKWGYAHVGNLGDPVAALKSREAWKYAELDEHLADVAHEFEFGLGRFVFDLCLPESRILLEFDGPDHDGMAQTFVDKQKEHLAAREGFKVVRVRVRPNEVIPASAISHIKYARQRAA